MTIGVVSSRGSGQGQSRGSGQATNLPITHPPYHPYEQTEPDSNQPRPCRSMVARYRGRVYQ